MPIYGYKCRKCGEEFEEFQRMSDDPITECPKCKGSVHRVFHPPGIIFKGSGFYTTDYNRQSKPVAATKTETDEAKPKSTNGEKKKDPGDKKKTEEKTRS